MASEDKKKKDEAKDVKETKPKKEKAPKKDEKKPVEKVETKEGESTEEAPKKQNKAMWIIIALVVVIALLAGGIGYYYYSTTKDTSKDDGYVGQLVMYYQQYTQAQTDYFTALTEQFAGYEDEEKHVFTKDDVTAIQGASDMYEERANAALDNLIALKAPAGKDKVQKEVAAAAKEMKEVVVPTTAKAQREIKAKDKMSVFMENSEKIYEEDNDKVVAVYSKLEEALVAAGVPVGAEADSGTDSE